VDEGALVAGDYLVLDNARVHHAKEANKFLVPLLDLAGVRLIFLPAYRFSFQFISLPGQSPNHHPHLLFSPELNPCELVFGFVKNSMHDNRGSSVRRNPTTTITITFNELPSTSPSYPRGGGGGGGVGVHVPVGVGGGGGGGSGGRQGLCNN